MGGVVSAPALVVDEAEAPVKSQVVSTASFARNMLSMVGGDATARVYGCNLPAFLRPDPDDDSLWFEVTDDDNLLTRNTPVMVDAPVMWLYVSVESVDSGAVSVVHVGGES